MGIRDVPIPQIGDFDVLIRVKAAGICGTDLHIREDTFINIPPVILGHEFSGEIVEVGKNVQAYKPGDRIVAEPHRGGCGVCRYCLTGQVEICSQKKAIGYKVDGCFAKYVDLPVTSLHRIPDNVPFEQAALAEPLAVNVKGVLERAKIEPEDVVVVLGCGPIGLLAAVAAKAEGARAVILTGTDSDEFQRLPAAKETGIEYRVNVQKDNLKEVVADLTHGVGKIDGRIAAVGITGRERIALNWDTAIKKAAHVIWSFSSNWTSWERTVALLGSGKIHVSPMISQIMPLDEWEKAFDMLERQEAIKILLTP